MPTMDTMDTHMLIMDTIMARDLLMLTLLLMPSMVPMVMDSHTPMVMVMPTMDTTDTHMLIMDIIMARDLLMLRLLLMLSMELTVMPTMVMDSHTPMVMDMPSMDTTDTHMLMDTTDIINLFIC